MRYHTASDTEPGKTVCIHMPDPFYYYGHSFVCLHLELKELIKKLIKKYFEICMLYNVGLPFTERVEELFPEQVYQCEHYQTVWYSKIWNALLCLLAT